MSHPMSFRPTRSEHATTQNPQRKMLVLKDASESYVVSTLGPFC